MIYVVWWKVQKNVVDAGRKIKTHRHFNSMCLAEGAMKDFLQRYFNIQTIQAMSSDVARVV